MRLPEGFVEKDLRAAGVFDDFVVEFYARLAEAIYLYFHPSDGEEVGSVRIVADRPAR